MTALPEKRAAKPAYMEQTSVNAFASQGTESQGPDASWTALPGQPVTQQLNLTSSGPGPTKQPKSAKDMIAEKNAELLELALQEERPQHPHVPSPHYFVACVLGATPLPQRRTMHAAQVW
jgi:hypothetical protein